MTERANNSGSITEDPDEFLFNGLGGPSREWERKQGEEETDMQDKEGKEDGPGEDSTLLGGRTKEENPEKVTGGDMPMPVWDIPR